MVHGADGVCTQEDVSQRVPDAVFSVLFAREWLPEQTTQSHSRVAGLGSGVGAASRPLAEHRRVQLRLAGAEILS